MGQNEAAKRKAPEMAVNGRPRSAALCTSSGRRVARRLGTAFHVYLKHHLSEMIMLIAVTVFASVF